MVPVSLCYTARMAGQQVQTINYGPPATPFHPDRSTVRSTFAFTSRLYLNVMYTMVVENERNIRKPFEP